MEHIIIGTAGHIDHGKTALIKALTGRDTDTIKEEKVRGISIDLGFTYFDLPDGRRAGVIDVPGHEKFLPNMLAGVCGMDLVLLVIALDEGIMPQTLEHMEILSQLGVRQGILVLSKADKVDAEWAWLVEEEIAETIAGTPFSDWERIRVSSVSGEGIGKLKQSISKIAEHTERVRNTDGAFRMPVDRVFSVEGMGTVLTGTVLEGRLRCGETIELYPKEKCVRVRGIQTHGEAVGEITAGQRAALLVGGMKKQDACRGTAAAKPETLAVAERLDVKLCLSKGTSRTVKNRARLHLHIGTARILCRAVLFGCEEIRAGESCYAQLILEEKTAVKKKDCFIIRFFSPMETIGGGVVLDACARRHKRTDEAVLLRMRRLEENKEEQILKSLICSSAEMPVSRKELERKLGFPLDKPEAELADGETVIRISGKQTEFYAAYDSLKRWETQLLQWMDAYHLKHPYRQGALRNRLKDELFKKWSAECFDAVAEYWIQKGVLCRDGEIFRKADFTIVRDDRFEKCAKSVIQILTEAGFCFPEYQKLCPEGMEADVYEDILAVLEQEKTLVRISEAYYTTWELVNEAVEMADAYFREQEVLTYTVFKEMLGTTRRYAKLVIAYLDRQRLTKMCGKETERKAGERLKAYEKGGAADDSDCRGRG